MFSSHLTKTFGNYRMIAEMSATRTALSAHVLIPALGAPLRAAHTDHRLKWCRDKRCNNNGAKWFVEIAASTRTQKSNRHLTYLGFRHKVS